ncbi:hypothetical protein [Paenibacillus gorillae]|uniref:hypothetical protein n=1 Tax=Paenibacillus gorillae TaxID=1243662 RepID=UPI0004B34D5E|nr:hypothetical protein [Paenibacillus gorillae]
MIEYTERQGVNSITAGIYVRGGICMSGVHGGSAAGFILVLFILLVIISKGIW